ncbi:peptidoglycan DD-metalloendopeptidase family protein [uncultured Kordia sp.]|uniref:peptidoglycan DD-metalloendopeptidase family protein n=1 Tax=uncultured Kordia sp. TaxID=507699 RepID=UPI002638D366|nr:peptidoglycan DD-metalloendopeptidase family protein [uncultured Kordia sp.]
MKSLYFIIFTLCFSICVHSQTQDSLALKKETKTTLETTSSFISLGLKTFEEQTIPKDSTHKKDWIAENWNTKVFNPYKKFRKDYKYPLHITFDDSTYASPIPRKKVITSRYGWRNRRAHNGIDIDLITGDRVTAMLDGVVRYVNRHAGHGKTVVVRHFNGLETVYAHLSKQLVKVNDTVRKGEIIGAGGTTGNARGSHLHLEVLFQGIPIHPEYIFDFSNEDNLIRANSIWVNEKWTTAYRHNSKRKSKVDVCTTEAEAAQSKADEKKIYTVRRGDTLSRISNKYNISIATLCKENRIRRTSTLKIGQKLIVTQ